MKIKWFKRKLTLVMIPGARGTVRRLHLPYMVLYLSLALLTAGVASFVYIYATHAQSLVAYQLLKQEKEHATAIYGEQLSDKSKLIRELQNQVIGLSQQAGEVKQQVQEMKKLESDLKSISKAGQSLSQPVTYEQKIADKAEAEQHTSVAGRLMADPLEGKGGTLIPVSGKDIVTLSAKVGSEYEQLSKEMDSLEHRLTAVKQEALRKAKALRYTPNIWPTDSRRLTSLFGYREDPFTSTPTLHGGIDIGDKTGSPVYATADGTVIAAEEDRARGLNILLEHKKSMRTWYMHLNKMNVSQGDAVTKGQMIGELGNTGRSTGPHLHYEVWLNGERVDPRSYLEQNGKDEH
ncbi:hypothetical protein SY83_12590 [Paenibacillus swuensis]|uniref:M23ase beta-sheet core domain-containing protein n=1 Tax=Paenibacillus swuensis TaxID=1178515 RepID=A0A172TJ24_9BACL|nr:M23 family metallopeptidase [Paenibacillus swuensis]ANE46972.1 hypothetical protein SY83_12590 [Paenibacillus swuensis]